MEGTQGAAGDIRRNWPTKAQRTDMQRICFGILVRLSVAPSASEHLASSSGPEATSKESKEATIATCDA